MRLRFWGAAGEVTGSCHFLEVHGKRLMLDAGLFQGRRKEAFEKNRKFPLPASEIDAVILSHAHLDHVGNLPSWVKAGYRGTIFATPATRDLAGLMLMDSAHIQASDIDRVNRQRRREGKRPFEPLYDSEDCLETLEAFTTFNYGRSFDPIPGVRATFLDAGHMLGSAMVVLDIDTHGKNTRLVFSGDLGHLGSPLLKPPTIPTGVDHLILESTYGDRDHAAREDCDEQLIDAVKRTVASGGKLLIPAFAVGRTQEVVYHLNKLVEAKRLPPIDAVVDSPLAVNVTEVFRMHPECFNREVVRQIESEEDKNAFGFHRLRYTRSVEESKALNARHEPIIVVSASGMCEAGRILHHLRNNLPDPRTTVLFVGYQAAETLGRKLLEGVNPVPILGEKIPVRAKLIRTEGFSGHADRTGLLNWIAEVRKSSQLRQVFLVHGEDQPRFALAKSLREAGIHEVHTPKPNHVIDLESP